MLYIPNICLSLNVWIVYSHEKRKSWHNFYPFFVSASVANVFKDETGEYDYVINLAAETKYGQSDDVSHYSHVEGFFRL